MNPIARNPITRNPKDFWTGFIYVLVGVVAIALSRDYGIGTAVKMGPAYFPTILSGLLIVIGTISVIRSFVKPGAPVGAVAWKGMFLIILSTLLFGFLARKAGTAVALPLMVMISAYASSKFRLRNAFLLAAGVTVFCVLIFQVILGVPLPIIGEWFKG